MGIDTRASTPDLKRKAVFINAEPRSLKRSKELLRRVLEIETSTNTIERICLEVGNDLEAAASEDWKDVLDGEVVAPEVAIVSYDGGRIRTRKPSCGPGVHLSGNGWNETKNTIFVNATRKRSESLKIRTC